MWRLKLMLACLVQLHLLKLAIVLVVAHQHSVVFFVSPCKRNSQRFPGLSLAHLVVGQVQVG